ncbi:MAG: hypothetical protein FWC03_05805 [Treponema sp.]|nr:hypothetical protein [Treponema sp.]
MKKMIKKTIFLTILGMFYICAVFGQSPVSLETAIQQACNDITSKLAMGPRVALVSYNSTNELSAYVLREMMNVFGRNRAATWISLQDTERALNAINRRTTDDISDADARQIGRNLNAGYVITGALVQVSGNYRFRTKMIYVSNGTVQASSDILIADNAQLRQLLGIAAAVPAPQAPAVAPVQTPAPQTPAPAAIPAPTSVRNGTYTFYPRPQATRAGVGVDAYIVKIVVQGRYMVIYLTNLARGMGGRAHPGYWYLSNDLLTNLDRPSQTYQKVSHRDNPDGNNSGETLSYENVTATRFSLETNWNGQVIFSEINLANAEYEP